MKEFIKESLKIIVPNRVLDYNRNLNELKKWHKSNCPVPPPHIVKQNIIKEYFERSKYTTFVETGTYMGDMVNAQKKRFNRIISIELGMELYKKAKSRFKNYDYIEIIQGDSGVVLPEIINRLDGSAIFWLDGHYSSGSTAKGDKDCPIIEELGAIFQSEYLHIILIDDARLFNGQGDYPTLEGLTDYIRRSDARYRVNVKDDVIRIAV